MKNFHYTFLIVFINCLLLALSPLKSQNYCTPESTSGAGNPFFTHILEFHLEEISEVAGGVPFQSYQDNTQQSTTLTRGAEYHLRMVMGNGANPQTMSVWIDFSQNGHFDNHERLFITTNNANDGDVILDTTFQVPENAQTGKTRLRAGTLFGFTPPEPCLNTGATDIYHHFQDYEVEIIEPQAQTIDHVTAFRNNENEILRGTDDNEIIGINVQTNKAGSLNPLLLEELVFDLSGTTNEDDIDEVKLYSTGKKPFFDNDYQLAIDSDPSFEFTFNFIQMLRQGSNYFWLAFDVSDDADLGNHVNASLKKAVIEGLNYMAQEPFPNGSRQIGYCRSYGVQNNFVFIDSVAFDSIHNQTGEEPEGYGDYTNLSTTVFRDSVYPLSLLIGNGVNDAAVRTWIDFGQTGTFNNDTDLVLNSAFTAGAPGNPNTDPVSDSIYIPPNAELGDTRMRINAQYNNFADACAMPVQTGEVEDYTIKIVDDGYPVAGFSFNNGCINDSVAFQNESDVYGNASIISYNWDFGDGNASQDMHPSHAFQQPGLHEVTLTVTTDAPGNPTHSKSQKIFISDPVGQIQNSDGAAGQSIIFSALPGDARIEAWKWHFNDPYSPEDSSEKRIAQHTYDSAGTYQVKLILTAEGGCRDTVTKEIEISEYLPPVAAFNLPGLNPYRDIPIKLSNLSQNNPVSYQWNFSPANITFHDNTSNISEEPVVSFDNSGSFTIDLIAENPAGTDTTQKSINVQDFDPPVADFSGFPTTINPGEQVNFTDETANHPIEWAWDFGDGDSSYKQHPYHNYDNTGFYTVSLTTTNPAGSDTEIKSDYIEVTNEYRMCNSKATESALDTGELYDSGGPGNNYLANSDCGFLIEPDCAGPIIIHINSISMNNGDYLQIFDGTDNDAPPLHNGSGFTGNSAPDSVVATSGAVYVRELNNNFFTNTGFHLTWQAEDNVPPFASFEGDTSGYINSPVEFSNTSDRGVGDTYYWDMNSDGNLEETGDEVTYQYPDTGSFNISLIGENCAGADTAVSPIKIVYPDEPPKVDFYALEDTIDYMYDALLLFDDSDYGPTTWQWTLYPQNVSYVAGTSSDDPNPIIGFFDPGFYDVKLEVSNSEGTNSLRRNNYILARPGVDVCQSPRSSDIVSGIITDPTGSNGDYDTSINCTYSIEPECVDSIGLIFHNFDFGEDDYLRIYDESGLSSASAIHPGNGFTHNELPPDTVFSGTGSMYIQMETDEDLQTVAKGFRAEWYSIMKDTAQAAFSGPDTILMGEEPAFSNHSQGDITAWKWDFENNGFVDDTAKNPSFQFTQSGDFEVQLIAESCVKTDTTSWPIHVIHKDGPPEVDFKSDYRRVPAGTTIRFTDLTKEHPWAWEWDFDTDSLTFEEGTSITDPNPVVTFTDTGTFDVILEASNFLGTSAETKQEYMRIFSYCQPVIDRVDSGFAPALIIDNDTLSFNSRNGGYKNMESDTLMLNSAQWYQFIVDKMLNTSGYSAKILLDYNQNGKFEDSLSVLNQTDSTAGRYWINQLKIPEAAFEGPSRLRLMISPERISGSCDSLSTGIVRDMQVYVRDKGPKTHIFPNGENYVRNNICKDYEDEGAYALMPDSTIIEEEIIKSGSVDTAQTGTYLTTYSLPDSSYPEVEDGIRIVDVHADHRPEIELLGEDSITVQVFEEFEDNGAVATDLCDGDISDTVQISEPPEINEIGYSEIQYYVVNRFGNSSDTLTRVVEVIDTIGPEIVLFGPDTLHHARGFQFRDPGAIAIDHYFGNLSVDINGGVNADSAGIYQLSYDAEDPLGNKAETKYRTVIVEEGVNIEKAVEEPQISFFPNPASDHLIAKIENEFATTELTIHDISGRMLLKTTLQPQPGKSFQEIELSSIEPGTYIVHWKQNEKSGYHELIIRE